MRNLFVNPDLIDQALIPIKATLSEEFGSATKLGVAGLK